MTNPRATPQPLDPADWAAAAPEGPADSSTVPLITIVFVLATAPTACRESPWRLRHVLIRSGPRC